jgi:hypothetical protein
MAGRRCLTLLGLAAALLLMAPTETSWAHPGKSRGHAKAHASVHAHKTHANVHKTRAHYHRAQQRGGPAHSSANDPNSTKPASVPTYGKTSKTSAQGRAWGRTHAELDKHPGKARGLFKHTDPPGAPAGQQHNSPPPVPPVPPVPRVFTGGGGEPGMPTPPSHQPVQQEPSTTPANAGNSQNGNRSGSPSTVPPTGRPPIDDQPAALSQVLIHSNPIRFTPLPIIVISVLALGVCGLIGLARHRA